MGQLQQLESCLEGKGSEMPSGVGLSPRREASCSEIWGPSQAWPWGIGRQPHTPRMWPLSPRIWTRGARSPAVTTQETHRELPAGLPRDQVTCPSRERFPGADGLLLFTAGDVPVQGATSIIPVYLKFSQSFEGFCPELTVFYIARFVNSSFLGEKRSTMIKIWSVTKA